MSTIELKENPETDGRKIRASNNRQKIVDAMISLVQLGHISPSAESVAREANVGKRTVFRRFTEMEALYKEMIIEVQKKFIPQEFSPFNSHQWQQQLLEYMDRKAVIYESLMPYRVAAQYHKHHSNFIQDNLKKWHKIEHKILIKILPTKIIKNVALFNALELSLSFDSWLQLRLDQGISPKQAVNTKKKMLNALLVDF